VRPNLLAVSAILVAAVVCAPLFAMAQLAERAGWAPVRALLRRPVTAELVRHTLALSLAVTVTTVVVGVGTAWLVERTDLPAAGPLGVLLVAPLAVPEFVAANSWVSLDPHIRGFTGALLVMTCAHYPLVHLPVRACLRRADPAREEIAAGLGCTAWATWWRVTLPQCRWAIAAAALVVCLHLLGEYGAFAALGYRTFATAIYAEYRTAYDTASAAVLALALCLFGLLLLGAHHGLTRGAPTAPARDAGRPGNKVALGRMRRWCAAGVAAVPTVAVGVPLYALVRWWTQGTSSTLPSEGLSAATARTLCWSAVAALIATVAAVPVALWSWRRAGGVARTVEAATYLTRALPGVSIGLVVVDLTVHHFRAGYGRPAALIAAWVLLFFPLALTGVKAGLGGVGPGVEEQARSLGAGELRVLARVTVPLLVPGLAVAAAMVALAAGTELTATLLLRPPGTDTLATRFWTCTSGLAYGAAAPYAAVMIGLGVLPTLLLARAGRLR
jgi:iron(III) transport system permease protein